MKTNKRIVLRLPEIIHKEMLDDLRRRHIYAYERIGFLFGRSTDITSGLTMITCFQYLPVDDTNYIKDKTVGAKINSTAIREAMQFAMENDVSCFHVHLHDESGRPFPSAIDEKIDDLIYSISNVAPNRVHGALILSQDSFYSKVKDTQGNTLRPIDQISVVGYPIQFYFQKPIKPKNEKVYDRQSFLGSNASTLFANVKVGIVGLGGGGSHISQQLSHIGITNIVFFDDDIVEDTNLNRLIGAWFSDIKKRMLKTVIAKRLYKKVLPWAKIEIVSSRWQANPEKIHQCDIVVGCSDTYAERQQLEAECRRYLIPYIDIGMDIANTTTSPYMSGQVILSMPGMPCMFCTGFLTNDKLGLEAAKYGQNGGRPQVVWANGVLASTAVGILVDLVTGWSGLKKRLVYLCYDGNPNTLADHMRLNHTPNVCEHFKFSETGLPKYSRL